MLKHLSIRNYVLIDHLEIDFEAGLTVITGETGSGKSIMLGALGLILGERADTTSLRNPDKKCIVEGTFSLENYGLESVFEKLDIDWESTSIFRREINKGGKSRAFINDTPVNLNALKEIGNSLVDIHSQFAGLSLGKSSFQLQVVDAIANTQQELAAYKAIFRNFQKLKSLRNELEEKSRQAAAETDYLRFQLTELEQAKLEDINQSELEEELNALQNAEAISYQLGNAIDLLSDGDSNVISLLNAIRQALEKCKSYSKRYESLSARLESSRIELKDLSEELAGELENAVPDPKRLLQLQDQADRLYKLEQKHGLQDVRELIELRNRISNQLSEEEGVEDRLQEVKEELEIVSNRLTNAAEILSGKRALSVDGIGKKVNEILQSLAMEGAELKVQITSAEKFSDSGKDEVAMLFSGNKGGSFAPIGKVASGGEQSRLMLAIKYLLAGQTGMPTLIFDEIDTGISGEVARKMGKLMREMAAKRQVITITHLPQIAGFGQHHFKVNKESNQEDTTTVVKRLQGDQRLDEIAQMLSGNDITNAARANARELLTDQ